MSHVAKHRRDAFTLVELLVVIAIIGVLVALLLPAIQAAREAARRTECTNHLKQIGLAVQMYHDTKKQFPLGRNSPNSLGVSWAFCILPYLEENAVFDTYVKSARVDNAVNARAMRTPVASYACPSRRTAAADRNFDNDDNPPLVLAAAALGDYAANAGDDMDTGMVSGNIVAKNIDLSVAGPIFSGSRINGRHVTDGLSNTLAVGEKFIPPLQQPNWPEVMVHYHQRDTAIHGERHAANHPRLARSSAWPTVPTTRRCSHSDEEFEERFGGPHPGVTLFVFLDGHADGLANSIEIAALKALGSVAGGEIVAE